MWIRPVSELRTLSFFSLVMTKPGLGSSTMNRLIASMVRAGSVRAATSMKSAIGALVMYSLLPARRQPPSTLTARVRSARMFEPPSGSLSPNADILWPVSAGRKKRSFCSGVPARQIGQMPRWVWADQLEANAWQTTLISSRMMQSASLSMPEPPSACG